MYVASTGSDANSGLAIGSPVLTLSKALEIVSSSPYDDSCTLFVLDTVSLDNAQVYQFVAPSSGLRRTAIKVKSFSQTTKSSAHVVSTTSANGGCFIPNLNLSVNNLNSTDDGLVASFTSGSLNGRKFLLGKCYESNGSVAIVTDLTPSNGSTFDVLQNDGVLSSTLGFSFQLCCPVVFENLDIVLSHFAFPLQACAIMNNWASYNNVRIMSQPGAASLLLLSNQTMDAAGFTFNPSTVSSDTGLAIVSGGGTVQVNMDGCNAQLGNSLFSDVSLNFEGGTWRTQPALYASTSTIVRCNPGSTLNLTRAQLYQTNGVLLSNANMITVDVDISESTSSGIEAKNSRIRSTGNLTSNVANSNLGMLLSTASAFSTSISAVSITLSGGVNEVQIGANSPAAWVVVDAGGSATRSDFANANPLFCSASFNSV